MHQPQPKTEFILDEFQVLRILGRGLTSQVYLVQDESGDLYAAKRFINKENFQSFQNQINIMKKLSETNQHENIIKILAVREKAIFKHIHQSDEQPCPIILLQYAKGGQLWDFLSITGRIPENIARIYFTHLLDGLKFIHDNEIAHRDLKPENILLSQQFVLKISDFGFSCFCSNEPLEQLLGTKAYLAPEVYKKKYHGKKVDIFAIGAILFTIVMGMNPFDHINDPNFQHLKNKKYDKFWKIFKNLERKYKISPEFIDLFHRLVAFDPNERPNFESIVDHEWLKMESAPWSHISEQFTKRLVRIESHKQKMKLIQQKKKKALLKNINPHNMRSSDEQSTIEFLQQIYQCEAQRDRNLQKVDLIPQKYLVLQENNNIAFAFLYEYLKQQRTENKEDKESDEEIQKLETIDLIQDEDRYMELKFMQYHLDGDQKILMQNTRFRINFKEDFDSNLVMSFMHISGSDIYFKNKYQQIKDLFYYCLKQECFNGQN